MAAGFGTEGYKPVQVEPHVEHQNLYLGVSLNAQGLFDWLLERAPRTRKVTHAVFEMFNVPSTFAAEPWSRVGKGAAGGA